MRSKDLAKAAGLAVAFDHTAPTFYRVSRVKLTIDESAGVDARTLVLVINVRLPEMISYSR